MNVEAKKRLLDGLNASRGGWLVEGGEEIVVRVLPDRGELAQQLLGAGREFAPERDAVAELIRERAAGAERMRCLLVHRNEHMRACTHAPHATGTTSAARAEGPYRFSVSRTPRSRGTAPPPAAANAVYHAIGVQVSVIPLTPERVWRALQNLDSSP